MQLIAVTGYAADTETLTAAGFDGHMIKPVNLRELEGMLAGVAAHRNVARRLGRPTPDAPAAAEPVTSGPGEDPAPGDA
jgi:hypothetical protein